MPLHSAAAAKSKPQERFGKAYEYRAIRNFLLPQLTAVDFSSSEKSDCGKYLFNLRERLGNL